jgi:hypothetical protein
VILELLDGHHARATAFLCEPELIEDISYWLVGARSIAVFDARGDVRAVHMTDGASAKARDVWIHRLLYLLRGLSNLRGAILANPIKKMRHHQ